MEKTSFEYYNDKIFRKYQEIAEIEKEIRKLKDEYKKEIGLKLMVSGAIVIGD